MRRGKRKPTLVASDLLCLLQREAKERSPLKTFEESTWEATVKVPKGWWDQQNQYEQQPLEWMKRAWLRKEEEENGSVQPYH